MDADLIGLSGLITPSLEEMRHVAGEMEREGFELPLLIGGATTSRTHTAVKIEPQYHGPVIHVADASRAVGVAASLLDVDRRAAFAAGDPRRVRDRPARARRARGEDRAAPDRRGAPPPSRDRLDRRRHRRVPTFLGVRAFDDYPLEELVDRIDWTPFFATWEMNGLYPAILDDPVTGPAARSLHEDALALLDRIVRDRRLAARAVVGFWPANSVGDDIELYTTRRGPGWPAPSTRCASRWSSRRADPNLALADFTAPRETGLRRSRRRLRGHRRARAGVAGRRGEGAARRLHRRSSRRRSRTGWPRRSPSGCTSSSGASCGDTPPTRRSPTTDLIAERYQGIRPAPGYPACPDHTEKGPLFEWLDAEARAGIVLTESFAMFPGASVSGYYFWHPQAAYFGLGRIGHDQLEDYAERKGMSVEDAERWLSPNLAED